MRKYRQTFSSKLQKVNLYLCLVMKQHISVEGKLILYATVIDNKLNTNTFFLGDYSITDGLKVQMV